MRPHAARTVIGFLAFWGDLAREGSGASDGIGHVLHRKWQVRKALGFAIDEAQVPVPALQIAVLADDPDADGSNGRRSGESNDMLYQASADAAIAVIGQNGKAIQVGETGARILVGNARDGRRAFLKEEVALAASKIGSNPGIGAQGGMRWAIVGIEAKFCRDLFVGLADEPRDCGDIFGRSFSDLHGYRNK